MPRSTLGGTVAKRLPRVHPTGTVEQETRVIRPGRVREHTRVSTLPNGLRTVRVWNPDTGRGVLTLFNSNGTVNYIERTNGSGERTCEVVHGFERLLTGDEDGGDVWCPPSMRGCSAGELEVDPIPVGSDRVLPPRGGGAANAPAAPRLVLSEEDLVGNPDPHALPGGGGGMPARHLDRGRLVNPELPTDCTFAIRLTSRESGLHQPEIERTRCTPGFG